MPITFDTTSSRLTVGSTPVTAAPLTLSLWARCTLAQPTALNPRPVQIDNGSSNSDRFSLAFAGSNGILPYSIVFTCQAASSSGSVASTTTWTTGQWHHLAGVAVSSSERHAYLDGGGKGTNTVLRVPSNLDSIIMGNGRTGTSEIFEGDVANLAIWNVALSDDEIVALAEGAHPFQFQRSSLVGYWPLDGIGTTERDLIQNRNLSKTSTFTITKAPVRR